MDLTTYMIITLIYWTIAFYYPFKTNIVVRTFWILYLIFFILRWMRGLVR